MYPHRKEDKHFRIYRFDLYAQLPRRRMTKLHPGQRRSKLVPEDEEKNRLQLHRNVKEHFPFQEDLMNTFGTMSVEEIRLKYDNWMIPRDQWEKYKKEWVMGTYDIAKDMLAEDHNIYIENHWMYLYYVIPKERQDVIDFIDEWVNKFSFNVKIVKRI